MGIVGPLSHQLGLIHVRSQEFRLEMYPAESWAATSLATVCGQG